MAEQWAQLLFETCEKGISSAVAPELLPDTQLAWGGNISARGGKPYTRPPWILRATLPRGLIQGGEYFGVQNGMLVVSIAGHLHRIRINNRHFEVSEIALDFPNSGVLKQVWMCQTVETLVIQDGQSNAILYNGSVAPRATGNQVPRGKMMAYGNGRLWLAINDKELIAGDIRTRNAGSELKFTETNYLTGGGSLYFPRGMTGLAFIPVTGQADYGALMAYGLDYSKAIRADVTQRDQWASIPGFEQSILNSVGAASQWSIVSVNQDLYWRDSNGGIRSIRNALADEQGPGSSPVSREVSRLTDYDSQQLMPWCSSVYHDNRLLVTSSPYLLPNGGIAWKNLIALDFAPLSTLQGKSQAAYDGQWSGLNIVKLLGGKFRNKNRAFALVTDDDGNNQLWETGGAEIADMTGLCSNPFAITPSPIQSWVEYPRRNFGFSKNRKRLERCDVWLSNVDGALDLAVYWRADNSQKWLRWDEAETCAKTTDAATETPHVWKNLLPQERPQFKTFTIPQNINELVGYAAEVGFEFQIRLVWTGFARIHRMMTYGTVLEDPNFAMRDEFQAACIENDVSGNQVVYQIPDIGCSGMVVSDGTGNLCGSGLYFGATGGTVINRTLNITNDGTGTVTLGTVLASGSGFSIVSQPAVTTLAPGHSTSFVARFDPAALAQGSFVGHLTIPSTDPDSPCVVEVTAIFNIPLVAMDCASESGHGVLCGFAEFTNPSLPPRFYLAVTNTGSTRERTYQPNTDCTGPLISDVEVFPSGTGRYNPVNCEVDCSQIINGGTCGPVNGATGRTVSETKTTSSSTGVGCVQTSGIQSRDFTGTWLNFLSDEDTETDAIIRASKTPGVACTAAIQPRGPGVRDFDFVVVSTDFQCTNLIIGLHYRITVEWLVETYGGGSPVVQTVHYDFVASNVAQTVPEVIDCPSGKQVTAQNVSIALN